MVYQYMILKFHIAALLSDAGEFNITQITTSVYMNEKCKTTKLSGAHQFALNCRNKFIKTTL